MGFSGIGLLIAISILAPSCLLLIFPPASPHPSGNSGLLFTLLERAGQACCLLLLVFSHDSFENAPVNATFVLMAACITVYYGLWLRYLSRGRHITLLYDSLGPIPIPMAVFPVFAFGFAAIWGNSPWIGIATIVLAVGHWITSWKTRGILAKS